MLDRDAAISVNTSLRPSSRVIDPLERSSEIIFGLIMALTFTSAVSVSSISLDIRTMLVAALGWQYSLATY